MSALPELLAGSGWTACASIRAGVERAGLPLPDADYLAGAFAPDVWARAGRAVAALEERFGAEFGLLLVPDPGRLDTRGAIDPAMRAGQTGAPDFVDERLPAGALPVPPGADWTLVATVTGPAGIHLGSYEDVRSAPAERFTVEGVDTRGLMTRQIWGARVLQRGAAVPDSNAGGGWTFTLFPGEDPVGGQAPSGTVLHGRVRFRLGRADRGIAPARVAPGLVVS